jgi:hypothetical protein
LAVSALRTADLTAESAFVPVARFAGATVAPEVLSALAVSTLLAALPACTGLPLAACIT